MLQVHISRDSVAPAITFTCVDEHTTFTFQPKNKLWAQGYWTRGSVDSWKSTTVTGAQALEWIKASAMHPSGTKVLTGQIKRGRPMPTGL